MPVIVKVTESPVVNRSPDVAKLKRMSYFPSPSALKASLPVWIVGELKTPVELVWMMFRLVALSIGFKLKYQPLTNSLALKFSVLKVRVTVLAPLSVMVALSQGGGPSG